MSENENPEVLPLEQEQAEVISTDAPDPLRTQTELVLRVQAEMENVRRRAARDVENANKYALEKFARELLVVVDNLERALAQPVVDAENPVLREGIEMTFQSLVSTLERFGISTLNPQGEAFNPEWHEAMSMVEQPNAAPNSVIAVLQKGFLLNGRLLRPAMVVVAKATATQIDARA